MKNAALILGFLLAVMCLFPLMAVMAVMNSSTAAAAAQTCTPTAAAGVNTTVGTMEWRAASKDTTHPLPGQTPYATRVPTMVDALNGSGATIVGFQQFQAPKAHLFTKRVHGHWALVNSTKNGASSTDNAIAYQPKLWTPAASKYVTIKDGTVSVGLPLVKFTSTSARGAATVWVLNLNNPTGPRQAAAAVTAEAKAAKTIAATQLGVGVVVLGNANDQGTFKTTFVAQAGTGWTAANPTNNVVDWILGGPGVAFSNTVVDDAANDGARQFTDQPYVYTGITLPSPLLAAALGGLAPGANSIGDGGGALSGIPLAPVLVPATGGAKFGRYALDAQQYYNAQTIETIASRRAGIQGAFVAMMVALTESRLHSGESNGPSQGVFMQTPPGWGTPAQVNDLTYATNAFLDHLAAVPNWRTLAPWVAAQDVQASGAGDPTSDFYKKHHLTYGYGGNYKQLADEAQTIVGSLAGTVPTFGTGTNAGGCTSAAGLPAGAGPFVPNTTVAYVGAYDPGTLMSRMQALQAANGTGRLDPFFNAVTESWYRKCQQFVAIMSGQPASGAGFASAAQGWATLVSRGAAHPAGSVDGMAPPPGAWLYYGHDHVVIYLGNNLVGGTDTWGQGTAKIGPAVDVEKWLANQGGYIGWASPWGH